MILFSNGCPKCRILESRLNDIGVKFEKCTDFSEIIEKGFRSVPILKLEDGTMLTFDQAIKYTIEQKGR